MKVSGFEDLQLLGPEGWAMVKYKGFQECDTLHKVHVVMYVKVHRM